MPSIDYLITTFKKSDEEIAHIIESSNIKGTIIVGNQGMAVDEIKHFSFSHADVTLINQSNVGVSKNRNTLLKYSKSDYVTFVDDDMYFLSSEQQDVEDELENNQFNCVRFNVLSDNNQRPIKLLSKRGFVGFRQLSSFGVWGGFYKRQFLIDKSILFNENIGPGTEINHGEDAVFNKTFLDHSKIYSIPIVSFHAKQTESTWHEAHRDLNKELFSHGYNYYLLYGKSANFMSVMFLLTHMKCYPKGTKYSILRKYMKAGIHRAKEDNK